MLLIKFPNKSTFVLVSLLKLDTIISLLSSMLKSTNPSRVINFEISKELFIFS